MCYVRVLRRSTEYGFYASSLLPRPPLCLSAALEKAASKSAYETALVARLREI